MFVTQKSDSESKFFNQAALEAFTSGAYMENFLDFVENIPDEIQRYITQMREIDLRYQELLHEMAKSREILRRDSDAKTRCRTLLHIQRALVTTQELGDKKLHIAQALQDIIDHKQRQLDLNRKKLDHVKENETHHSNDTAKSDAGEARPNKRSRRQRHTADISLREEVLMERHEKEVVPPPTKGTKKKKKRKSKVDRETDSGPIDPPIDPDEPTYCLCNQVSFGEMIGCDNEKCDKEWFHFSCVGLTIKPKGKWYCPSCRGDRSNQMRPVT